MLGVDYNSFMMLTPSILNNTYKRRLDHENQLMYIAGLYNHSAFSSVIGTAFGKKKVEYLEEPIDFFSTEEEAEEKRLKRQHETNKARWHQMMTMVNQKFKE